MPLTVLDDLLRDLRRSSAGPADAVAALGDDQVALAVGFLLARVEYDRLIADAFDLVDLDAVDHADQRRRGLVRYLRLRLEQNSDATPGRN